MKKALHKRAYTVQFHSYEIVMKANKFREKNSEDIGCLYRVGKGIAW